MLLAPRLGTSSVLGVTEDELGPELRAARTSSAAVKICLCWRSCGGSHCGAEGSVNCDCPMGPVCPIMADMSCCCVCNNVVNWSAMSLTSLRLLESLPKTVGLGVEPVAECGALSAPRLASDTVLLLRARTT